MNGNTPARVVKGDNVHEEYSFQIHAIDALR